MFHFVRIIIGFLFLLGLCVFISKFSKITHKRISFMVSVILSVLLVTVLSFAPVENLFITFDSPQKAYNYRHAWEATVETVVPGEQCDLVVGIRKDDAYVIELLPKTDEGWKIGTEPISKSIVLLNGNKGVSLRAYRYMDTDEYFIRALIRDGRKAEIMDSENSEFFSTEANGYITYYAHISSFNESSWIGVNGNKIYPYK